MGMSRRVLARKTLATLFSAWLIAAGLSGTAMAQEKLTVFAAASMKNALDAANAEWSSKTGIAVTASYAASSALAKQIEAGAPADLFISADLAWMDYVEGKKLIRADSRTNLFGNQLVLIAPSDQATQVKIEPGFDLGQRLGENKLAMGAVETVPAGKYGKAALEKLGIWPSVENKVAGAESVRAALLLVSRGEAPYGIVYQTDAAADPGVAIVGTFPNDSHDPIIYPAAILADSKKPAAQGYLDFLKSSAAAPFFEKQGFTIVK